MYLTDRDSSVCLVYTLDGKPIQMLGRHGVHSDTGGERAGDLVPRAAGPFNYPAELVPGPDRRPVCRRRLSQRAGPSLRARTGSLKFSWGEPGKTESGHFHLPHSLVVHDDLVYVCDRENHRLQVFDTDGKFVTMWTDLQQPMDISVDKEGIFYVSEGKAGGIVGARQCAEPRRHGARPLSIVVAPGTAAGSTRTAISMWPWANPAAWTNSCARVRLAPRCAQRAGEIDPCRSGAGPENESFAGDHPPSGGRRRRVP